MNHFVILRLAVFILGLTLSIAGFFFVAASDRDKAFATFNTETNKLAAAMELELASEISVLQASRSFYEAFGNVTGDAFRVFANNAVEMHPEIHSIKWVPQVLSEDREKFERELEQEARQPGLRITENNPGGGGLQISEMRDDYFPLLYMAPDTKEWALGFDLASEADVRNALETASDNQQPTASAPMAIDTVNGRSYAYVIALPIYTKKLDDDDKNNAPKFLKGFVVGVLDIAKMFNKVVDRSDTWNLGNSVSIEDNTAQIGTVTTVAERKGDAVVEHSADGTGNVLHHSMQQVSDFIAHVSMGTTDLVVNKQLEPIAYLQWQMVGTPSETYLNTTDSYTRYWVSGGIMLFALLIEAYLRVLQRMDRELQSAALSDSLTGVANRRRLFDHLQREWQRAKRFQRPISFILIDVDNFKKYNDTYGHQKGDRALHDIAQRLQTVVMRPGDLVARYGGEEFGIVLSESDLDAAMLVAEKCREAVQALRIPHQTNADWGVVTISMGVSSLFPSEENPDYDRVIERADSRLYVSKEHGRNCATPWREGDS